MTKDEQARARLVEIALETVEEWNGYDQFEKDWCRDDWRRKAGFKNPQRGHFCAAGLTDAMQQAGLVVPAPGTPARRGAVALLDFVANSGSVVMSSAEALMWRRHPGNDARPAVQPGDIIAWLQNQAPAEWLLGDGQRHAFATMTSPRSMCGGVLRSDSYPYATLGRCSSCVWETRKGHVALIVAVDAESITTVGWNEGNAPGRVMKLRLWRDPEKWCVSCGGTGYGGGQYDPNDPTCTVCRGRKTVPRSSTVLCRRPGGLYGIARPVAR